MTTTSNTELIEQLAKLLEENGYKVTPYSDNQPKESETWDDYGSPDKNRKDPLAGYENMGEGIKFLK